MKTSRNTTLTLTVLFVLLTTAIFTGCSKVYEEVGSNENSSNNGNSNIESAEVTPAEKNLIQTVEKAIQDPNKPEYVHIPANVKVLSLSIEGNVITVNYSREILANGTGVELEDVLYYFFVGVNNEIINNPEYQNIKGNVTFFNRIEGKSLEEYRQK